MIKKHILYSFLLLAAVSLLSCNGKNKAKCGTTKATVVDYSNLDGCGLLLELDNGTTLSPFVISAPGMGMDDLKNAKRIKIDYREIKGIMSICMRGKSAEITCMKIIEKGTPKKAKID